MMKNLKRLADMLCDGKEINGYDGNEACKAEFGRIGKQALKELAVCLSLTNYKINYNQAGPACSGDLTLIGMRGARGIYISINKDMVSPGVLYRSIKHMKDFTGGGNRWVSFKDFGDIENSAGRFENVLN